MADLVTQLGLIFFVSVIFMLLALRFKMPQVVGLLFAGAIIGPNALGLVTQNEYLNIFAEIGAILLLFFVGIKFSINKIVNVGLRSFIVWLVKDGFVFIVVYEISALFGLNEITSIVLASSLAISSTTFFIKLIEEKNLSGSPEASLVFVVLIIEDLLAVFFLAVYSGMAFGNVQAGSSILLSILKAVVILTVTSYVVLQKVMHTIFERISKWKSEEVVLFSSLSFAILLSFFASFMGLAPSIGAFLAGNLLSSLKEFTKNIQNTLSKFSMLFSAFFFLSVGMLVNFETMAQNITIIAVLFVLVVVSIFFSMFASSYLLGYRSISSVRAGLLILAVGEFSLLIAKQTAILVAPFDIVSVISTLVFLTALTGGILVQYDKQIDSMMMKLFPQRIRESGKNISLYLNKVLEELEPPKGSVYSTFAKEWKSSMLSLVFFVIIGLCAMLAYGIALDVVPQYTFYVAVAFALVEIIPLAALLFSLKKMMDSLAGAFHKAMGENLALDDLAMLYSTIALLMFLTAFVIPLLVSFLNLPRMFGLSFIIPLTISLLFIWNLAYVIKKIIFKHEFRNYERKRASFKPPYRHIIGEIKSINQPKYKGYKK